MALGYLLSAVLLLTAATSVLYNFVPTEWSPLFQSIGATLQTFIILQIENFENSKRV